MPGISVKTLMTTTTITEETELVPAASGEDVNHRLLKVIEPLVSKRKMLLEKWAFLFGPNTNKSIKKVK